MNKRTPLYEEHVKLGANIVPFGGWDMPVYYTSVIDEHNATRERAGLFDTSHMGEVEVSGAESLDFLQSLMSNDIAKIKPGEAIYAAMTNERGGVVDDLWVYMLGQDNYCLVVNASTTEKDLAWIQKHAAGRDVKIVDHSERTGMVALQGPVAVKVFNKLAAAPAPARFKFAVTAMDGMRVVVSRTGYTGEDGVEIYSRAENIAKIWNMILGAGTLLKVAPVGLGARDTLRLEACYSLYGHELSEDITPIEAAISFAVAKGKKFIGCEIIHAQMESGASRKIVAFELTGRGIPRGEYPIYVGGEKAGVATSGCFSPTLKKGIGLAMVDIRHAAIGTELEIEIREKRYEGKVVKKPFVKNL